ncbi:MAG TPA: glutamyl-tRNA reductase [Chthoniobacteraceae bacterium]|jgi:glutamyl-tRNA reductase|nr:glutamyl-tRNA reductase [Chthoniobacteraceae bacterium]
MKMFVAGMSYKTAPVEVRERLAIHATRLDCCGCRLKLAGGLSEVVLVSTCNRVEVYGVGEGADAASLFQNLPGGAAADFSPYVYYKEDGAALDHLFSVAGGLDSMVLGETEITAQIKQAYQTAQAAKLTGKVLNRVFQTALQTAKEIRTRTNIGRGAASVGSVAVELAEQIFGRTLCEKTVMILGTGKMGEGCVRHLCKKGARSVLVSNRSFDRAEALAADIGGTAIRFDRYLEAMADADIVVSSTSCPHTILYREEVARVMAARRHRPLVLIDIAVPRDIAGDVQDIDNVYLYDVDDLEKIVRENVRLRERELGRCAGIIEQRREALLSKIYSGPAAYRQPKPEAPWAFGGIAACQG